MRAVTKEMVAAWLNGADRRVPYFVGDPARWHLFLADVRKFAAGDWLEKFDRLGWSDEALFHVDRLHPFENPAVGRTGLLPALKGREVRGVHPDYAVLGVSGVVDNDALHPRHLQAFSRHHNQSTLVLIWTLMPEPAATI